MNFLRFQLKLGDRSWTTVVGQNPSGYRWYCPSCIRFGLWFELRWCKRIVSNWTAVGSIINRIITNRVILPVIHSSSAACILLATGLLLFIIAVFIHPMPPLIQLSHKNIYELIWLRKLCGFYTGNMQISAIIFTQKIENKNRFVPIVYLGYIVCTSSVFSLKMWLIHNNHRL